MQPSALKSTGKKQLPTTRIVRYLGTVECDTCPHCGAHGKIVHRVQLEDGRTVGAMSGCINLFPWSEIAREEMRLSRKREDYKKRGWTLNRVDTNALKAIEDFYAGIITEYAALNACRDAKAWSARKWSW